MAETTQTSEGENGVGTGMIMGIVLVILIVILFFLFNGNFGFGGAPTGGGTTEGGDGGTTIEVPDEVDVNVNQGGSEEQ